MAIISRQNQYAIFSLKWSTYMPDFLFFLHQKTSKLANEVVNLKIGATCTQARLFPQTFCTFLRCVLDTCETYTWQNRVFQFKSQSVIKVSKFQATAPISALSALIGHCGCLEYPGIFLSHHLFLSVHLRNISAKNCQLFYPDKLKTNVNRHVNGWVIILH